jgi:hypothetical protein
MKYNNSFFFLASTFLINTTVISLLSLTREDVREDEKKL